MLEAGRAFLFWTALHGDLAHTHPDEAVRQKGEDYMALLTPVLKAFLTERGFAISSDAMQVHGGSGFTEHFPASQYLRDSPHHHDLRGHQRRAGAGPRRPQAGRQRRPRR